MRGREGGERGSEEQGGEGRRAGEGREGEGKEGMGRRGDEGRECTEGTEKRNCTVILAAGAHNVYKQYRKCGSFTT